MIKKHINNFVYHLYMIVSHNNEWTDYYFTLIFTHFIVIHLMLLDVIIRSYFHIEIFFYKYVIYLAIALYVFIYYRITIPKKFMKLKKNYNKYFVYYFFLYFLAINILFVYIAIKNKAIIQHTV